MLLSMANLLVFDDESNYSGSKYLSTLVHPYSFEEAVARLYFLAKYDIFYKPEIAKCSFTIFGKFKNKFFSLYDMRDEKIINIGGHKSLDVKNFKKYVTSCYYEDNGLYGWPFVPVPSN